MATQPPPETTEQAVLRLEMENKHLRFFVSYFAGPDFHEVHYFGIYCSSWVCPTCGYTAPNAGHYLDCKGVEARALLGKKRPLDTRLYARERIEP